MPGSRTTASARPPLRRPTWWNNWDRSPPDCAAWAGTPHCPEPAGISGCGWRAWALGVPWLSAELATLVAARWPQHAREMLIDPDWAVWPPPTNRGRTVIAVPPLTAHPEPTRDAYAAALLTNPLADALPAGGAAAAMSRVHGGAALDEALTEIAPELSVSALLAQHVGLPTVELDPRPRSQVRVDALGRTCRTADWDDPVRSVEHAVLAEPDVVPVHQDPDGSLLVAVADPLSPGLAGRLSELAARPVRITVAARDQVQRARKRLLARRSLADATLNTDLSSPHWERVALHSAQWKVPPAQAILDLGLDVEASQTEAGHGLSPERMRAPTRGLGATASDLGSESRTGRRFPGPGRGADPRPVDHADCTHRRRDSRLAGCRCLPRLGGAARAEPVGASFLRLVGGHCGIAGGDRADPVGRAPGRLAGPGRTAVRLRLPRGSTRREAAGGSRRHGHACGTRRGDPARVRRGAGGPAVECLRPVQGRQLRASARARQVRRVARSDHPTAPQAGTPGRAHLQCVRPRCRLPAGRTAAPQRRTRSARAGPRRPPTP